MNAYCDASGVISFGPYVVDGCLPIAKGPQNALMNFVSTVARHAYDNETLLVPGVPEAPDQITAVDALLKWLEWIGKRPPEGIEVCGPGARKTKRRQRKVQP